MRVSAVRGSVLFPLLAAAMALLTMSRCLADGQFQKLTHAHESEVKFSVHATSRD
jgi:hypothetical protein